MRRPCHTLGAAKPISLLKNRDISKPGTWNERTVYEFGKDLSDEQELRQTGSDCHLSSPMYLIESEVRVVEWFF